MLLLIFAFVVGAFVAVTSAALLHCSLGCWLSHAALSAAGSLTLLCQLLAHSHYSQLLAFWSSQLNCSKMVSSHSFSSIEVITLSFCCCKLSSQFLYITNLCMCCVFLCVLCVPPLQIKFGMFSPLFCLCFLMLWFQLNVCNCKCQACLMMNGCSLY